MYETKAPQKPQRQAGDSVSFAGRVTRDFELFTTNNGNVGVNIDFAMDSIKQGTIFGRVTYWGTTAQIAVDFLGKGDVISGTGKRYWKTYPKNDGTEGRQLTYDGLTLLFDISDTLSLIQRVVNKSIADIGTVAPTTPKVETAQPQAPVAPTPTPQVAVQEEEELISIDSEELPF